MSLNHDARRAPFPRVKDRVRSIRNSLQRSALLLPQRVPRASRELLEAAAEAHATALDALLRLMDSLDGDGDNEPSLGSTGSFSPENDAQENWGVPCHSAAVADLEECHDGEEFSWVETHGKGAVHGAGGDDDEPSLAHTNDLDQSAARRALTKFDHPGASWGSQCADLEAEHDGREPEQESNVVVVDGSWFGLTVDWTEMTVTDWRAATR